MNKEHKSMGNILRNQLFIDFCRFEKNYQLINSIETEINEHKVNLSSSGILSFPWRKESVLWMLKEIPKPEFKWEEDSNHSIALIKPFNIYFVINGNHSIAGGRLYRKGTITCKDAIDYSKIISEFDFNGKYFYNKKKKRLNKPFLNEFGQLFILGKVLLEKRENSPSG